MKAIGLALLGAGLLAASAARAPQAAAKAAGDTACDLTLDVIDPDPNGLNVRATPSLSGKVITQLKPTSEWTEVHVAAQRGDWLRINHADSVDDEALGGMSETWAGSGWVHRAGLGVSELSTGEGTVLRAAPDDDSAIVRRIVGPDAEPKQVRVLGCRGKWLQVEADGVAAWTRSWCNNQRTTCS
jgi:hypothetical protein